MGSLAVQALFENEIEIKNQKEFEELLSDGNFRVIQGPEFLKSQQWRTTILRDGKLYYCYHHKRLDPHVCEDIDGNPIRLIGSDGKTKIIKKKGVPNETTT